MESPVLDKEGECRFGKAGVGTGEKGKAQLKTWRKTDRVYLSLLQLI